MVEQRGLEPGDGQHDEGHFAEVVESGRLDPLTGIPPAYTLAATQEPDTNEADRLMVKHFLDTLGEIALSIASRKAS